MFGTLLNVSAILLGGVTGRMRQTPMAPSTQGLLKRLLGLSAVLCGFWLIWRAATGLSLLRTLLMIALVLVSMMVGKFLGQLLRLQRASNHLGRYARDRMGAAQPDKPLAFAEGFHACTIVFCAAPLGIVGALVDGLSNLWPPLLVKAFMDGLATMGFVSVFGRASMAAALPVLAFQGTIAMSARVFLRPWLEAHALVSPVVATAGVLMLAIALVILESKRIELADYLPSLAVSPLLMGGFNAIGI